MLLLLWNLKVVIAVGSKDLILKANAEMTRGAVEWRQIDFESGENMSCPAILALQV